MKLTHTQLDLVAAYVKDELSGKAMTDFEAALAENEVLREEVLFQRSLLNALQLNVVADTLRQATFNNLLEGKTLHPKFELIQNTVNQVRIDNAKRQRHIRRRWLSGLVAAACVLGAVFFGNTLMPNYQLNNTIASWEVEFDALGSKFEEVGSTTNIDEEVQVAKEQYAKGNKETALAKLNMIPKEELPDHILLAKGKIEAQLKNYQASKQSLLLATKSNEATIRDDARLVLGMVYLRLNEKEAAKNQLEQIRTESSKREAEQMMEKYL